jgi:rhodanese-related sulfurtransferase
VKTVSDIEQVPASQREQWVITNKALEIDVREPKEWAAGTIDGITKISMGDVPARLDEFDKDVPILVVCRSGARSQRVAEFLTEHGYTAANLAGGMIDVVDHAAE